MLYQKAKIKAGRVLIVESTEIDGGKLTSDCWLIQFDGLKACKGCELRYSSKCGGGRYPKSLTR